MSELFPGAPLAGPRRQRIGGQPVVAGIVPEIGARRRVILHTANDLNGERERESNKKGRDMSI